MRAADVPRSEPTDVNRAERQLAAHCELVRLLAGATTLEATAPKVLEAIAVPSGWEAATLWLVGESSKQLESVAFWHHPELELDELERATFATRLERGVGLAGYVWAIGRAAWVVDDTRDPDSPLEARARQVGLHGAVGCPIFARDEIGGVLEFFGRQAGEPDAEQLRMLEAVQLQLGQLVERIDAEREVEKSRHLLASVIEGLPDPVFVKDAEGRYLVVNEAVVRADGLAKTDILGKTDLEFRPEESAAEFRRNDLEVMETGRSATYAESVAYPDGSRRQWRTTKAPLRDSAGGVIGVVGVAHEVTEQLRVAAALQATESELRQAHKLEAVGRLAGGVAHDFNNLMTAILGYSDLLLPELAPEDQRRGDVQEIRRAAERGMMLTRQLLAFSRREVLDSRPLDVNTVVAEITSLLRRLIGDDVELETVLGSDLAPVSIDRGQLEQVIVNLAVNAHDAMPNGGRVVIETANATDPGRPPGARQYALLSVTDTGTGMDESTLARIFDPYFTTKERGKGTGLGLSTVYGIVDSLGGHVVVDSEPERGTRFAVYLPTSEWIDEAEPVPDEEGRPQGTETVLLVEDEPIVRSLTARILLENGYRVLEAARGDEALAIAADSANQIDLVVSDIVMPGMNGLELGERLRRAYPHLRFVFVSGYADSAFGGVSSLPPDAAFVEKPFTPPVLLKRVREALD